MKEKRMSKPECLIFVAKQKQNQMSLIIEEKDLDKFILIGDRVLIRPKNPQGKTASGLYLPPTVQENEKTQSGYIVKVGPGYPIPAMTDIDEPWKEKKEHRFNMFHFKPKPATWLFTSTKAVGKLNSTKRNLLFYHILQY